MRPLDPTDLALLDAWQRDFPLAVDPWTPIAATAGLTTSETRVRLRWLLADGALKRIGATVRPNTAGASTLAAFAVPEGDFDRVAAIVTRHPYVNHNYRREHDFDLWFVVAAPHAEALRTTLDELEAATGLAVLDLPLEKPYHIDLGFRLDGRRRPPAREPARRARPAAVEPADRAVLAAIEDGLPVVDDPFGTVGALVGLDGEEVIARLARMLATGTVSRFGFVLDHRRLGYTANAMAVWDVPDERVDEVAAAFVATGIPSLCYRRPRRRPVWPYNLFCMIHAKDRLEARARLIELDAVGGTAGLDHAVLFSTDCLKQRGAVFSEKARAAT